MLFKFSHWHRFCKVTIWRKFWVVLSTGLNSQIFHHSSLTPTCGHCMDEIETSEIFAQKQKRKKSHLGSSASMPAQHLPTGSMASLHPRRCYLQRFRPRDYYFSGRISSKPGKIHSNLACSIGRLSRHTKKTRAGREGQLRNKVTSSSKEIREISSINTCATRAMPSLHSDTSSCHGISQQTIQTRISFHDS